MPLFGVTLPGFRTLPMFFTSFPAQAAEGSSPPRIWLHIAHLFEGQDGDGIVAVRSSARLLAEFVVAGGRVRFSELLRPGHDKRRRLIGCCMLVEARKRGSSWSVHRTWMAGRMTVIARWVRSA
jgi:hypothetical protein